MFSNLQRLNDQKLHKQQYSPQSFPVVPEDYFKIQQTVKKNQKSSITPSKRIKTLEENFRVTLNENSIKYDNTLNFGKKSPKAEKNQNLTAYIQQAQRSQERIKDQKIKQQQNKDLNQSYHLSYFQQQKFDPLPAITPKSSKLANILGTNNKQSKDEIKNQKPFQFNQKLPDDISSDPSPYRFYTPQKMREGQKQKFSYPSPINKQSLTNNQLIPKKAKQTNPSMLIQVPDEFSINRINSILDQVNQKTLKKESIYGENLSSTRVQNKMQKDFVSSVNKTSFSKEILTPTKRKINQDNSFQASPAKQSIANTNVEFEMYQKNTSKNSKLKVSEKVIQELKNTQNKDQLITILLKPFEDKSDQFSMDFFNEYFNTIDTVIIDELLSHVQIDRLRYLIKVSFVYEWMAMIINCMIKVNMIQNKSGSDQMRFTKVIYANNLILKKNVMNAIDGTDQPLVLDIIEQSLNYIELRCNQFFFMNHTITPNQAQLNTLLSYITESIIIMNITNTKLQEQAREYYRLRVDTTDLKVFLEIIKQHFIPELNNFLESKNKLQPIQKKQNKSVSPSQVIQKISSLLPSVSQSTYTLVLDLDETLVHFQEYGQTKHILVRPFVDIFLKEMSKCYELVIFTAGLENYANWVLDQIDPKQYVSHRLYRQHTQFQQTENSYLKDLSRLGRPLDKTLIIDNSPQNFSCQKMNGIQIRTWFNDPKDTALNELIPFLRTLRETNGDVRFEMKQLKAKYRDQQAFVLPA